MPNVRMPDGTIIRNVPEGFDKNILLQKYNASRPKGISPGTRITEASPVPEDFKPPTTGEQLAQFPAEPSQPLLQRTGPQISRESARAALPALMGTAGAVTTGGLGLVPILGGALAAGAGQTGGELIKQKLETGETDLADAVGEGGEAALATAAGGFLFKGLGAVAKAAFTDVPAEALAAARFAKKHKVPLPIAGQPGKMALAQEVAQKATLPARQTTINTAKKINSFINQTTARLTKEAKPIDEVAQSGQTFFRNIFKTAQEAGEGGFKKFTEQVGANSPVEISNFNEAAAIAITKLKERGISGALVSKLRLMQKNPTNAQPLDAVEGIRKELGKIARRDNKVKTIVDDLVEGIMKDYDNVGAQIGVNVRKLSEEARSKFSKFANMKKEYPQLERFSKQFGERGGTFGSKQWFGELFTESNAKALNQIRKDAPALYRELSDSWLSNVIDRHTVAQTDIFGKVLDGEKLGKHIAQNEAAFKKILGSVKTRVLKNFANYAEQTKNVVSTQRIGGQEAIERISAESAAAYFVPHIMVPSEGAAYVLAKGLSNPNSVLYKSFLKHHKVSKVGAQARLGIGPIIESLTDNGQDTR